MRSHLTGMTCLLLGLLVGCADAPPPAKVEQQQAVGFVQGRARVISVDPAMGRAVLEIGGRHVQGYWQTEAMMARGGAFVPAGPLKPPIGDYREPVVRSLKFPARPGDLINYIALQTGDDLLLRGVEVVGH